MSTLPFFTLDVFTDRRFSGNPLAVVMDADDLSTANMQCIAREFNLSETVFVQRPTLAGADVRVRIFTPAAEVPFAGHPSVGTACLLAELDHLDTDDGRIVLQEEVGLVRLGLRKKDDAPYFAELSVAQLPRFSDAPDAASVAPVLGLEADDIAAEGPLFSGCGLDYLLVPLRSPELLAAITLDALQMQSLLTGAVAQMVLVYARGYEGEMRARMFAPALGVPEDPATGSAAVALAGRLANDASEQDGRFQWTIHQGLEMGRPSRLYASAEKRGGEITAVRVGGHAVRLTQGTIHV